MAASTRTTRLPTDLIVAAETDGRAEHRSAAKQLEHWARLGMFFDRQTSAAARRIQRAVAGDMAITELPADERIVANAAIDAAMSVVANETSFADLLAARGVTTVVMDDAGNLIRRHPDGSTSAL